MLFLVKSISDDVTGKTQKKFDRINQEDKLRRFYPGRGNHKNPSEMFLDAVIHREIEAVKQWLTAGYNTKEITSGHSTPLHHSASAHMSHSDYGVRVKDPKLCLEITKLLVDSGARINAIRLVHSSKGYTPLDLCLEGLEPKRYKSEIVETLESIKQILLKNGAVKYSKIKKELCTIKSEIMEGKSSALKKYISNGYDINITVPSTGYDHQNFLSHAVKNNKHEIVDIILSNGGKMIPSGTDWNYPLHITEDVEMAKLLIKYGADVNKPNRHDRKPLAMAKDEMIKEILIQNGANSLK